MKEIPEITCHVCSNKAKVHYDKITSFRMLSELLCFHCLFWTEKVEIKDAQYVARINGKHYEIAEDTGPDSCRGFGGQKYKIKFNDGRIVETRNLWYQGDIPEYFKAQLPDNAEFVKE
jgi:hypothetical protein